MKKSLIAALGLSLVAFAGMAKEADELRIYINPGHGSWTPNDRPNPIIGHGEYSRTNTDTTNFFESNTNLRKGFSVLEALREYGLKFDPTLNQTGDLHRIGAARDLSNNIVMSHVKCGPYHDDNGTRNQLGDQTPEDIEYYNRALSEICQEVDANNFDMFISIHSNAATEGTSTNFPLFLYRGFDTPTEVKGCTEEHQKTSRAMADACWSYAISNPHMMWTSYSLTNKNLRGDCNFYKDPEYSERTQTFGWLGVLRHHVPGFLVEGYFHTYQPARHRAMNWDVDYMEGLAYAHGIADYFGLKKESTGCIYGIVRDANERFSDKYYKPNTATLDRFLPLNGVKVILSKDGKEVANYTTDEFYNGAFVFQHVEPGTYTINFESKDYQPLEKPLTVEVKAAEIAYPTAQLVNVNWVPEKITYVNYPDPMAEVGGVSPASEYNLEAVYTNEIPELKDLTIRRAIVNGGKMYILALDKPLEFKAFVPIADQPKATILVYDLAEGKVLSTVSTEGAAGSRAPIADIQVTADGVLLACNATKNQYSEDEVDPDDQGRGKFVIYKWANDAKGLPTGNPVEWIPVQNTGLWFRTYPSMFAYSGTSDNGSFVIPQPTIADPYKLRASMGGVIDGEVQAISDYQLKNDQIELGNAGADFTVAVSPLDDLQLLSFDSKFGATASAFDSPFFPRTEGNEALAAVDGRSGMFKYSGASYVVVPEADGLKLVNIASGIDNATETKVNLPEGITAAEALNYAAAGEVEVSRDELTEVINSGWINLYLLRGTELKKFTTKDVAQPQAKREFAYEVNATDATDAYEITFKMTGDAPAAALVFTNAKDEADVVTVELGAVKAGENSAKVEKSQFDPEGYYEWEVRVTGEPIAQAGLVKEDASGLEVRGSVVPITDHDAESFGYVTVGHGRNAGIDVYDPLGNKVSDRIWVGHKMFGGANGGGTSGNQSNPIRGDELGGLAVLATWGDAGYGMVATNPLDAKEEPYTLFAGSKSASGCFTYNKQLLGGGTSGISFVKEGDQIYALSFSEDHENQNGQGATENALARYKVNLTEDGKYQITEAPEILGFRSLLLNTNVDLVTYGKGVFASQVRGAGNNQAGTPCFCYIADVTTAPDLVMTSAEDQLLEYIDNNTSGIAVTNDGKTLACALAKSIAIISLEWDGNTPTPKFEYSFPIETHTWSTMRFDAAGNLHVYLREGGYRVYSLPSEAPVAVTKAPTKCFFGVPSSVQHAMVEAPAAEAVYYNLQGIRMQGNLTPGIYVKVSGNKAEKVVIR